MARDANKNKRPAAVYDSDMDLIDMMDGHTYSQAGGFPASAHSSFTVSPQDLALDASAPNSNTFTNLTTPSMYDGSPDDLNGYETSPLFSAHDDFAAAKHWPSLFQTEAGDVYAPADPSAHVSHESLHDVDADANTEAMVRSDSATSSASANAHRTSLSSGGVKNRRTGRPLPEIEVDEHDTRALKRAKNTLAARKSRQKKRDVEDQLRYDLAKMTAERDRWMHLAIAHGAPLPESKTVLGDN